MMPFSLMAVTLPPLSAATCRRLLFRRRRYADAIIMLMPLFDVMMLP